ncbi:MAG TPA: hypothetical protein VEA41_11125 [Salinarimonas sp.]|nr:hypothetical protein [Salinarimonas sp.]
MLVYGDPVRVEDPAALLARIAAAWREAAGAPPGIARHARIAAALVEAGRLAQALADLAFEARGRIDERDPADEARMGLCLALGRALAASWDSGFVDLPPPDEGALAACAGLAMPARVTLKRPEGYAFYALYPEAILAAARRLGPSGRTRVVGIRSIGTGLAAVAAAALGDPAPVTVRPTGHPFAREARLGPALGAHLTDGIDRVVIVDEGPGLSGSSFGAVADAIEALGMARGRIAFLPSHGGDLGPQASAAHRARWAGAVRPVVAMDALVLDGDEPAHRLASWVAALVGSLDGPLEEISGGAWRSRILGADEARWPAVAAHQERRKFLARAGGRTWLVKFAGLGEDGERIAGMAARLAEAGFTPPVAGFVHGFLVQRWLDDARPLDPAQVDRPALLAQLARYLAARARLFPAAPGEGASGEALAAMVRRNVALALGDPAGEAAGRIADALPAMDPGFGRIATDNRLQSHEWLVGSGGRLWKTDAVDHHAAHDLVGSQDLAWDVAGAAVELGLAPDETEALCDAIAAQGGAIVDRARLSALPIAYLALHLGRARLSAQALAGWPQEARRLDGEAARYEGRIRALLARA